MHALSLLNPHELLYAGFTLAISWIIFKLIHKVPNQLHGSDIPWLYDTYQNRMVINGYLIVDKFTVQDMIRLLDERVLPNQPRMKQYVVQRDGYWCWETDTQYKSEHHVILYSQDPTAAPMTKNELEKLAGEMYNRDLPLRRPPYEFIIVENYGDETKSAILCRSHHVIADGIGFVGMMLNAVDPTKPKETNLQKKIAKMKPSKLQLLYRLPMVPFCWLKAFTRSADSNELHGVRLSGKRHFFSSQPIPFEEVKQLKDALQCTVNDVLMACLAGAFHAYFARENSSVIPDITLAVPVSMRSLKEMQNIKLCNKISVVMVSLDVSSPTQQERLQKTMERMKAMKDSPEPLAAFLAIRICSFLPASIVGSMSISTARKCTAILSNVPGPQEPLHYFDRQVHELCVVPPTLGNVGVGVSILSYNNCVRINISTDEAVCDSPEFLSKAFMTEFENFKR